MNLENSLPVEVINSIQQFLDEKKKENDSLFVNEIIRDDIFEILETFCTVVYFPLDNEENDGCHVSRIVKDEEKKQK